MKHISTNPQCLIRFVKVINITGFYNLFGRVSSSDHGTRENIDSQILELSACYKTIFVNSNLTGLCRQYIRPIQFKKTISVMHGLLKEYMAV